MRAQRLVVKAKAPPVGKYRGRLPSYDPLHVKLHAHESGIAASQQGRSCQVVSGGRRG
jgi:hypothetical protein